jgi:hypothetical protein
LESESADDEIRAEWQVFPLRNGCDIFGGDAGDFACVRASGDGAARGTRRDDNDWRQTAAAPPPKFGGVIKESWKDSTPWWAPRVVPPKGAPNILLIMTDDQGYGVSGTFGGVIPTLKHLPPTRRTPTMRLGASSRKCRMRASWTTRSSSI